VRTCIWRGGDREHHFVSRTAHSAEVLHSHSRVIRSQRRSVPRVSFLTRCDRESSIPSREGARLDEVIVHGGVHAFPSEDHIRSRLRRREISRRVRERAGPLEGDIQCVRGDQKDSLRCGRKSCSGELHGRTA
jgi:hypothetical protein